uniref:RING-type domain-containing protein n=1 Tax=Strongyloides venezuelensis TaxID=75913 RepID=A0A0K0FMT8_STRVS
MTSHEVDLFIKEIGKILSSNDVQKLSFEFKKNDSNESDISLSVKYKNSNNVSVKENSNKCKTNSISNASKKCKQIPNFKDLDTALSESTMYDIMTGRFINSEIVCDGTCNKMNPNKKMKVFGICDHVICKSCRDQYNFIFKMFNLTPSCTNLQCLTSTLLTVLKEKDKQLFKECCQLYNYGDYKTILGKIINIDYKHYGTSNVIRKKVYSTTGNIGYFPFNGKEFIQNFGMDNVKDTSSSERLKEQDPTNSSNSYNNDYKNSQSMEKSSIKDDQKHENAPVENIDNALNLVIRFTPSRKRQ